jgi:hypothetical protein
MAQDHVARFMQEMPDIVTAQPQISYVDAEEVTGFGPMGEIALASPDPYRNRPTGHFRYACPVQESTNRSHEGHTRDARLGRASA